MDHIYVNNSHSGKIGDTLVQEPALAAYAERHHCRVVFGGVDPAHLDFFLDHPYISAREDKSPVTHLTLSVDRAFHWAHQSKARFTTGFFHQVDIDPASHRQYFRFFGFNNSRYKNILPFEELKEIFWDNVIIIPYAHSCSSRSGESGLIRPGVAPNLQPPADWWRPVVMGVGLPSIAMMGSHPDWNPHFLGLPEIRGCSALWMIKYLSTCRCLITVETGAVHLAETCDAPTVFLSSGTPPHFVTPRHERCIAVRAARADQFDPAEVVAAVRRLANAHN